MGQIVDRERMTKPPLIEAIFELKWAMTALTGPAGAGTVVDPDYQLFVGMLFECVRDRYPHYAKLPAAEVPPEMIPHGVQYQFRTADNAWPLLQVGPGVITVNAVPPYQWAEDFGPRVDHALEAVWRAHPQASAIRPVGAMLRYIDGVEFDFSREDVTEFLAGLGVRLGLPDPSCAQVGARGHPQSLDLRVSLDLDQPGTTMETRYVTGVMRSRPALIWETMVAVGGDRTPTDAQAIGIWKEMAHERCSEWFFSSVQGRVEAMLCEEERDGHPMA